MHRAAATLALGLTLALAPAACAAAIDPKIEGPAGDNGWYKGDVVLTWNIDPAAIPDSPTWCDAASITITRETSGTDYQCAVHMNGIGFTATVRIKIDRTPPAGVAAIPARPADGNGWFSKPVQINWGGQDAMSGIANCTSTTYSGPDRDGSALAGKCRDKAGNESADVAFNLKYDATPPQITSMKADRPPDRGGWYVRPLTYNLQATDGTSGVDSCPPLLFQGPDDVNADATGTCTDRAGNAATTQAALRYDATAPVFDELVGRRSKGTMKLQWRASPDTESVTVARKPDGAQPRSFSGASGALTDPGLADGVKYTYVVTATDAAGNTTARTVGSRRPSNLLAPAVGARLRRPPLLRWRAIRKADYYNVQIFDGERKILSTWPRRTRLHLHRTWRYGGALRSLRRGHTYRWFVWPGFGRLSAQKYGRLLGQGRFSMR